jgi:hypothetical protein
MLNPELQKNIDLEIEKSPVEISEFLHGKYFKDTISMISRVSKLNETQLESLELEVILNVLKLSEYKNFYDAVLNEVFPENLSASDEEKLKINTQTKQISSDIQSYIFYKLEKTENDQDLIKKEVDTKNLRQEISEKVEGQNAFNLLKTNNNTKKIDTETKSVEKQNFVTIPNIALQSEPIDFYKEKVDPVDKVIKKEIEAVYNKDR